MCTRTIGVRPSSAARSLVVTSRAAEPSEICEEFAAVILPSSLKAGFRPASLSSVPPRRMPSSASTTVPSGSVTGAIWPAKRPSSWAAAAFSCEARANSSSCWRDKPQLSAIISAPTPWFGKSLPYRAW